MLKKFTYSTFFKIFILHFYIIQTNNKNCKKKLTHLCAQSTIDCRIAMVVAQVGYLEALFKAPPRKWA